jgi:hypothetical protein
LKRLHCTIHSHNKAGASQSGDDAQDELTKNGWHITVGHCDQKTLDFHMRYNFRKHITVNEEGEKIAPKIQSFIKLPTTQAIGMDPVEGFEEYTERLKPLKMSTSIPHPALWESYHEKTTTQYGQWYGGQARGMGSQTMFTPEEIASMSDEEFEELANWSNRLQPKTLPKPRKNAKTSHPKKGGKRKWNQSTLIKMNK